LSHFAIKLFFAAPLSGLPSDPIAFGPQASRLHFAIKLVFAAPASGFPSFETALFRTFRALAPLLNRLQKPLANLPASAGTLTWFHAPSPFRQAPLSRRYFISPATFS